MNKENHNYVFIFFLFTRSSQIESKVFCFVIMERQEKLHKTLRGNSTSMAHIKKTFLRGICDIGFKHRTSDILCDVMIEKFLIAMFVRFKKRSWRDKYHTGEITHCWARHSFTVLTLFDQL